MMLTCEIGLDVDFPGGRPEGKIQIRLTVQGRKYDKKFSEGTDVKWDIPKRMYVFCFEFRNMDSLFTMLLQSGQRV